VQAAKTPASSLHSKVLLASVDVKLKLALVLLVVAAGLAVIVVSGAVVSMVQVKLAGVASVLPTASVARTWKVWLPTARAV
jgi:adenine deaminase